MRQNSRESASRFMSRHHGAFMALCCIVPLALVALFSLGGAGLGLGAGRRPLSLLASLLCPLSMIVMMFFMGKDHDHGGEHKATEPSCHSSSDQAIDITDDPDRTKEAKRW